GAVEGQPGVGIDLDGGAGVEGSVAAPGDVGGEDADRARGGEGGCGDDGQGGEVDAGPQGGVAGAVEDEVLPPGLVAVLNAALVLDLAVGQHQGGAGADGGRV